MYLCKQDILAEEEKLGRRNTLRRLFNTLQQRRQKAHRKRPFKGGGKLEPAINCTIGNKLYSITDELSGRAGTFSQGIYIARNDKNEQVVLKRMDEKLKGERVNFKTEINYLSYLNKHPHANIIKLLGYTNTSVQCIENHSLFLVLEYADGGDLFDYMQNHNDETSGRYMQQIVSAMAHAHSLGIAHRDLKLENIFVQNGQILVGDWGGATRERRSHSHVGTEVYMSPQLVFLAYKYVTLPNIDEWHRKHDELTRRGLTNYYDPQKADVWALGVLLFHLFISFLYFHPFSEWSNPLFLEQLSDLENNQFDFTAIDLHDRLPKNNFGQKIMKCLKGCWAFREETRFDVHDINHVLFDVPKPPVKKPTKRKRSPGSSSSNNRQVRKKVKIPPLRDSVELPTLFVDIGDDGAMVLQGYHFKRTRPLHYDSRTPLKTFIDTIDQIKNDGQASACDFAQFSRDFDAFQQSDKKCAFATVSLQRNFDGEPVQHATLLMFHKLKTKDDIVLEFFDGRGKDLEKYSNKRYRNFYEREKMKRVLQSLVKKLLREKNLVKRMVGQRPTTITIDYMERFSSSFSITNPNECRNIALTYLYYRLKYKQADAAARTTNMFADPLQNTQGLKIKIPT